MIQQTVLENTSKSDIYNNRYVKQFRDLEVQKIKVSTDTPI